MKLTYVLNLCHGWHLCEILYMEEELQNAQMCLCTSFKEVLMYFEMNMMCLKLWI